MIRVIEDSTSKDRRLTSVLVEASWDLVYYVLRCRALSRAVYLARRDREEPTVILLTGTSWSGLTLPDAEDKLCKETLRFTEELRAALRGSQPRVLQEGEWHMPSLLPEDAEFTLHVQRKLAVVRCDALEYLGHRDTVSQEAAMKRFTEISQLRHPRALEHVATPAAGQHGNFLGWKSLRESMETPLTDKRVR